MTAETQDANAAGRGDVIVGNGDACDLRNSGRVLVGSTPCADNTSNNHLKIRLTDSHPDQMRPKVSVMASWEHQQRMTYHFAKQRKYLIEIIFKHRDGAFRICRLVGYQING
jgi:hypothetical protein